MFLISVDAYAETASFRVPESHTFQQTLPLPPLTTVVGMVGAALGLSFEESMNFRSDNNLRIGVSGSHGGEFRDLWKYQKIKSTYKEDGSDRQDILIREYLFDFRMHLSICLDSFAVADKVRLALLNPVYALTAGNSDSLTKVNAISDVIEADPQDWCNFENTILPGDCACVYEPLLKIKDLPITETIRSPRVFLLPTEFSFNGLERRVKKRESFTFVGSSIHLNSPIPAYSIENRMVALL